MPGGSLCVRVVAWVEEVRAVLLAYCWTEDVASWACACREAEDALRGGLEVALRDCRAWEEHQEQLEWRARVRELDAGEVAALVGSPS